MRAYYNENDSYAAQWLRNLIEAGHIMRGDVDERSILDVTSSDVCGYTRCHFFAGIGGWDLALRLAGWPDERPIWTGSCPCQPFSAAGKGEGFEDKRHLWPTFFELIRGARPNTVMGEQVASKAGLGWLDLVHADLEGAGYTVRAADLCAAGVGAPHIRQRLWWVGISDSAGSSQGRASTEALGHRGSAISTGGNGGLDDTCGDGWHASRDCDCRNERLLADAKHEWCDADWLPCRDGKARPVEPGTFPLAHGVPARVGRLRALGNAIVPQVAAEFIKAVMS